MKTKLVCPYCGSKLTESKVYVEKRFLFWHILVRKKVTDCRVCGYKSKFEV